MQVFHTSIVSFLRHSPINGHCPEWSLVQRSLAPGFVLDILLQGHATSTTSDCARGWGLGRSRSSCSVSVELYLPGSVIVLEFDVFGRTFVRGVVVNPSKTALPYVGTIHSKYK